MISESFGVPLNDKAIIWIRDDFRLKNNPALSYAINNVKNQDDIVTTPCNRIMSNHLDEALEHDLQVPTITAVSMDQQILVAKQKEEEQN